MKGEQGEKLIRITGGPIVYDEFKENYLNNKKWSLWSVEFDDKKYFSYTTDQTGLTLYSKKNCFDNNNYYGISSSPIRGLTDISLVVEVELYHETSLPAIVHLCNCCSEFTRLPNDDFWCEVDIYKDKRLHFNCVEFTQFIALNTKHKELINKYQNPSQAIIEKYLVKITQSLPSYEIEGFIRPIGRDSKYELIGSTLHPYPLSQAKIELKTYTNHCDDRNILENPIKIATFRNMRLYKNPKNNPLFIRVVDENGLGVKDFNVQFEVKNLTGESLKTSGITDKNGYATLILSELSVQEYPILNFNIKVFEPNKGMLVFDKNFNTMSIKDGIYPGDIWLASL